MIPVERERPTVFKTIIQILLGASTTAGMVGLVSIVESLLNKIWETFGINDHYGDIAFGVSIGSIGGSSLRSSTPSGMIWDDETPYCVLEQKADTLYQLIYNKQSECYCYPALVIDSKEAFSNINQLLNPSSLGKTQETLRTLETVLECLQEQ